MRRIAFTSLRKTWAVFVFCALLVSLITLGAPHASADVFTFTGCDLSGGCGTATNFGTVTLTQSGTSVNFDLVLTSGNRFVETGAGGHSLFVFNDSLSGSTITNITATLDGSTVIIPGGLSGLTNQSPIMADGTGTWTAEVFCTTSSDCNGGSAPDINDLHFTVTNATLAQLETANPNGNMFVTDLLLGQTGGTGQTGPVIVPFVPTPTPEPGTVGLMLFGIGLLFVMRKRIVPGLSQAS